MHSIRAPQTLPEDPGWCAGKIEVRRPMAHRRVAPPPAREPLPVSERISLASSRSRRSSMARPRLTLVLLFAALSPVPATALQVSQINVSVNDVVLRRQDGYLYASVAGSDATYGNKIIRIDPATGVVLASLAIGSEPGKLAVSDDGTKMYVALGGAAAVRPVDLVNFTAGTQFALGSDQFFGPFYAEDLSVQPGNP